MMRQLSFTLFLFTTSLLGYTQNDTNETIYITEKEIIYREDSNLDDYMRERCRLDIYYPKNIENFNTIIWFHGGGLKAGNKFIPDQLKEQGFAVVAVNYRFYPKVKCPA